MVDIIVLEPETGQQKTYTVPTPIPTSTETTTSTSTTTVGVGGEAYDRRSFELEKLMELLRLVIWHLSIMSDGTGVEEGEAP